MLQLLVGSHCPKPELGQCAELVPGQHGHGGYFGCLKECEEKPSFANGPFTSGWHGGQYPQQLGHTHRKYGSLCVVDDGLWPGVVGAQKSHPHQPQQERGVGSELSRRG